MTPWPQLPSHGVRILWPGLDSLLTAMSSSSLRRCFDQNHPKSMGYPAWWTNSLLLKMATYSLKMVIFHSYVSLPEGTVDWHWGSSWKINPHDIPRTASVSTNSPPFFPFSGRFSRWKCSETCLSQVKLEVNLQFFDSESPAVVEW
jgi:hypothetical protein